MFTISLRNIEKVYARTGEHISGIEGISMQFNPGEILGLLGPNGAGKTTLLKIIAMVNTASHGELLFNGIAPSKMRNIDLMQLKQQIGYLPEIPFIYTRLTGEEYLLYLGELYGVDDEKLKKRLNHYFNLFAVAEKRHDFLSTYSQGNLKKIFLIATLINDQDILILDEPTNSLDPHMISILKDVLSDLKAQNKTIILSTHILDIAERLSDRIAIIDKGHLQLVETIDYLDKVQQNGQKSKLEQLFLEITS